jgi:hypothetical protein
MDAYRTAANNIKLWRRDEDGTRCCDAKGAGRGKYDNDGNDETR